MAIIKQLHDTLESVKDLRDSNNIKKYVFLEFIIKDLKPVPPETTASALAMQHAAAVASVIHNDKKHKTKDVSKPITKNETVSEKELYAIYTSNSNDDQIYIELSKYDNIVLSNTYKRNEEQIKTFDTLVEEKTLFDMRKGRKPKKYASVVESILKYREMYNFLKRIQNIILKIKHKNIEIG